MTVGIFHGPRATKARERVHNFVTGLPDEWHEYRDSWHDKNRRPRRIGEVVVLSLALSVGVPVALHTGKPAGHELRLDPDGQGGKAGGLPQAPPLPGNTVSPFASPAASGDTWRDVNTGGQPSIDSTTLHCGGIQEQGAVGGPMVFKPNVIALSGVTVDPNNVWTIVGELGPSGTKFTVSRGLGSAASIDVEHNSLVSVRAVDGGQLSPVPQSGADMRGWVESGNLPDGVSAWCGGQYGINP